MNVLHQPVCRSDLPRLAAARSLSEISGSHNVAGVSVVLLQQRGAGSHVLCENVLVKPASVADGGGADASIRSEEAWGRIL